VEGSETLYRLRVGKLRVEYEVCNSGKVIKIVKIFQKKRKSGYR
jgi:mRNA-degrading endonuclease RelE of RelBE toxin-antitoxin system